MCRIDNLHSSDLHKLAACTQIRTFLTCRMRTGLKSFHFRGQATQTLVKLLTDYTRTIARKWRLVRILDLWLSCFSRARLATLLTSRTSVPSRDSTFYATLSDRDGTTVKAPSVSSHTSKECAAPVQGRQNTVSYSRCLALSVTKSILASPTATCSN